MGCSPWGRWGSDTTEQLHFHFSLSCIGEGNGNPLQCSCLENPRDGGALWAAVYGVAQSWTRLKWLSSILVRSCLKSCVLGFSIMWTKNFQMSKLGLEKKEELEIKLPTPAGWYRKQGNFRKTSISASLTALKPVTVWIMTNCRKLLQRWEHQTISLVSWEILPDRQIFPSVHLGLFYTS